MQRLWLVLVVGFFAVAGVVAWRLTPSLAPRSDGPAPVSDARATLARQTAEERLRARLRIEGPMMLRAVQVHRQAAADTLAVCGQINPAARADGAFIPYVAVLVFEGTEVARGEFFLAATSQEAARVYIEMVDKCFDGGGPMTARAGARPIPPLPSEWPRSLPPAAPATPAPAPPPLPPGSRSVVTSSRHPVNIRASPGGGGAILRVVPRGSQLQIFAEAAGGWLQVGEGEPWGWLHASMLEER